jgi:type I restriction enzyme S subunit
MTGASLGSMAIVRRDDVPILLNQRVGRIIAKSKQVNVHYLYFVLSKGVGSEQLINLGHGSAQPNLSSGDFGRIQIPLPPIAEQRAIAGVLGALDDKIESNRRLQEVCMSLAITEHVCWRENVHSFVETTFGDFCDVFGGATPSTEEPSYWGGEFAWLTPTDVTALDAPYLFVTSRTLTEEGLMSASTRLHPIGTVFMTSRATIGAFAVAQNPCATNQGFIAVQPRKDHHRWFIFHEMKSRVQLMIDMSSGSTFRELSRGTFKNIEVSIPESELDFERLAEVIEPLHSKAANASRENFKLRALRDSLLPELLSGRLRVKDAESMMENV